MNNLKAVGYLPNFTSVQIAGHDERLRGCVIQTTSQPLILRGSLLNTHCFEGKGPRFSPEITPERVVIHTMTRDETRKYDFFLLLLPALFDSQRFFSD